MGTHIRKFWLPFYWLLFACLSAIGGTSPGYYPKHMQLPPFPFAAVAITWMVFAIVLFILHWVLYQKLSKKLLIMLTVCLVAILLYLLWLGTSTDLPGFFYVTSLFALLTLLLLVVRGLRLSISLLYRRLRGTS